MNYKEMLNRTIESSGLKNVEIIAKMNELGVNITPNYFSVLRNTENKVPSDEVSRAIAQACGVPKDLLVIQGQLDKTSEILRDYIEFTVSNITSPSKALIDALPDNLKEQAIAKLNMMSTADIICDIMSNKDAYTKTSEALFNTIKQHKPRYALVPLAEGEIKIIDGKEDII